MSPWPLLRIPKLLSAWKGSSQLPTGLKDPSITLLTIPPNVFWRKHTQKCSRAVPGSVPRSDPWRGGYRGLPCWPLTTLACKHESVQSERKGEGRAPYYRAHTDLSDILSLWHGGETKAASPPPCRHATGQEAWQQTLQHPGCSLSLVNARGDSGRGGGKQLVLVLHTPT